MAHWRDIRDRARLSLHKSFEWLALYKAPNSKDWTPCHVRLHEPQKYHGGLQGTSFNFAEMSEVLTNVVFLTSEIFADRGGIVTVADGRAFLIDHTGEAYGVTTVCPATQLKPDEAIGYPKPESYMFTCVDTLEMSKANTNHWVFPIGINIPGGVPTELILNQNSSELAMRPPFNTRDWVRDNKINFGETDDLYDITVTLKNSSLTSNSSLRLSLMGVQNTKSFTNLTGDLVTFNFMAYSRGMDEAVSILLDHSNFIEEMTMSITPRSFRVGNAMIPLKGIRSSYIDVKLDNPLVLQADTLQAIPLSPLTLVKEQLTGADKDTVFLTASHIGSTRGEVHTIQVSFLASTNIQTNRITITIGDFSTSAIVESSTPVVPITMMLDIHSDTDQPLYIKSTGPCDISDIKLLISPK